MEQYIVLILIGVYVFFGILFWIIEQVKNLIDLIKYKSRLNSLRPQLIDINTDNYTSEISRMGSTYSSLIEIIRSRLKICKEKEPVQTVQNYINAEATHRRKTRKSPARKYRKKYWNRRRRY